MRTAGRIAIMNVHAVVIRETKLLNHGGLNVADLWNVPKWFKVSNTAIIFLRIAMKL